MPYYENSLVYKLCCNDPEITDIYVGSTCNFKVRKYGHKRSCHNETDKEHNRYVYRFIRENGGWENWSMVMIKKYPEVKDMYELHHKERKWIRKLKATLNKQVPGNFLTLGKIEYNKQYNKQYREKNEQQLKQKAKEQIECECGCMISRSHISCHKKTKKHSKLMNNR